MPFFRGDNPKVKGLIGYYKLADWWLSAFSQEERDYIESHYSPLGGSPDSLTKSEIKSSNQTAGHFLSGLATWFRNSPIDRSIARRILEKSAEMASSQHDIMGLHFTYRGLIEIWYKDRDSLPEALDQAIKACEKQIEIAPKAGQLFKDEYRDSPLPSHTGFGQLIIIRDKQGRFDEAIRLCLEAKQQGWAGDWDSSIQRYEKKKAKKKS